MLEAIDRHDHAALCEELGDFLFEAVFLLRSSKRGRSFTIADSLTSIADKLSSAGIRTSSREHQQQRALLLRSVRVRLFQAPGLVQPHDRRDQLDVVRVDQVHRVHLVAEQPQHRVRPDVRSRGSFTGLSRRLARRHAHVGPVQRRVDCRGRSNLLESIATASPKHFPSNGLSRLIRLASRSVSRAFAAGVSLGGSFFSWAGPRATNTAAATTASTNATSAESWDGLRGREQETATARV